MPVGRRPRLRPDAAAAAAAVAAPVVQPVPVPSGSQTTPLLVPYWDRDFIVIPGAAGSRTVQLQPRNFTINTAGLCTSGVAATHALDTTTGRVGLPSIVKHIDNHSVIVTKPVGANWRRCVWLSDILANSTARIPGQYVTWLVGRLIEACVSMHGCRVSCNRLIPQTIAVNQHDHELWLCDWRSSAFQDARRASPGWSAAQLEALDVADPPTHPLPYAFTPEHDTAGLVGILAALIDRTDGTDAVWLARQLSVLRSARRAQRPIAQYDFNNWHAAAAAAYGPRRRFNFVVDAASTCFLA